MHINELFSKQKSVFSFEVFPPKKNGSAATVLSALDALKPLKPDFISVTYGAGASAANSSTVEIASHIKSALDIEPLAHLTCVASTRQQVAERVEQFKDAKIENVLALRGDISPDIPPANDFAHASDLALTIRQSGNFNIVGACYPEGHYENKTLEVDIDNLKYKIEAGVTHLITQLFFDNAMFYRFIDMAEKRGVRVPIQAGVMPIVNTRQIERTVAMSGSSLPPKFTKIINKYESDADGLFKAGIEYAVEQINDLLGHGVRGIHLYIMNNPTVAKEVYEGIRPSLGR